MLPSLAVFCPLQVRTLGGDAAVQAIPLGPIPHPEEEQQQGGGGGSQPGGAAFLQPTAAAAGSGGSLQGTQTGGQQAAQQQTVRQDQQQHLQQLQPLGDRVVAFDEISVAAGALGRFPGSQVMPLVRQFVGVEPAV